MKQGLDRRQLLALGSVAATGAMVPALAQSNPRTQRLSIEPVTVELAPGAIVRTTGYNGLAPGPVLRLKEGEPVEIAVHNATLEEETFHWGGPHVGPSHGDAMHAGDPTIPAGADRTYRFTPSAAGTQWYHAHGGARTEPGRGTYSGQFGFLLVDPRSDPARHDREVLLAAHHWGASLAASDGGAGHGAAIRYAHASFNDRKLGAADPIRVRQGERVLFRILNASATEDIMLALPGHRFTVIALDGAPVPNPQPVEVLALSVAERADVIVEMDNPGVWVLGSVRDADRAMGLGVIIEYRHAGGPAVWRAPARLDWDYARFAAPGGALAEPDGIFTMQFEQQPGDGGVERWSVNGQNADRHGMPTLSVKRGGRYRFRWINLSGEAHPLHLQRHRFELTRVDQTPVRGLIKDIVTLPPYGVVEADLIADSFGPALFHSRHPLRRDAGFTALIRYV